MKKLMALCALLLSCNVNAALIQLTWNDTASFFDGAVPGTIGESISTSIFVDNGGSSVASQSWSTANFVSYRIEGASGWWIESNDIEEASSSGLFSTDAAGNVISAGNWIGKYFNSGTINTSWAGVIAGGWWNNGNNQVACSNNSDCVEAANVSGNLIGSNWRASEVTSSIPEPNSILLLGLGLMGVGVSRKKKTA